MNTPRRLILIGPSGSGKTTLARLLADRLNLLVISLDDFRVKMNRNPPTVMVDGQAVRAFDSPPYFDYNAVWCKMQSCVNARIGFVAEGTHLLHSDRIAAVADTERYYLDCTHVLSLQRRAANHKGTAHDESFRLIGEGETAKYIVPQKLLPGVRVLDARYSPEKLLGQIVSPVAEGVRV